MAGTTNGGINQKPQQPSNNNYGFVSPTGAASQAVQGWENKVTGETFQANSGGYTNPDPNWTRVNRLASSLRTSGGPSNRILGADPARDLSLITDTGFGAGGVDNSNLRTLQMSQMEQLQNTRLNDPRGSQQRRYFPSHEQGPRHSTGDSREYINPFTGQQEIGSSTHMSHLNAMAEKYGTNGNYIDGVDTNGFNGMPMLRAGGLSFEESQERKRDETIKAWQGEGIGGGVKVQAPMLPQQGGMFNMGNTETTRGPQPFNMGYRGPQPNMNIKAQAPMPPQQGGMIQDLRQGSPTNGQMIPRPNATQDIDPSNFRDAGNGFSEYIGKPSTGFVAPAYNPTRTAMPFTQQERRRPLIPQNMTESNLNSGVQQMAAPSAGGYNVNTASAQGLQKAQQGAAVEMGYRPMQVNPAMVSQRGYDASTVGGFGTVSADNVNAGQLAGSDLSAYTNPYETQVVDQALGDIERQRLMAQNVGSAQAGAANAFGGSRQGIAEAETNRAYMDQAAKTASGLRQAGYMNAQDQAGQDISRRMQAGLANQQANMQAGQFNVGTDLQRQQANQAARNQAGQFGANAFNQAGQMNQSAIMQARLANQNAGLSGSQQRLSAGQQLGSLSNLGFGMGQQIQGRMDQQGAMQQALQQQIINAGKQQYAGYTGAPAQSLQYLLQAVGGAPSSGTTQGGYSPGLFDYLSLGAGNAAGLAKAFGG